MKRENFLKKIYSAGFGPLLLTLMLAISAFGALAVSPQEAVTRFAETPRLPSGSMAVIVSDLATDKILASYNADKPLVPASIMKSITIASLASVADIDAQIETSVSIEGKVNADGVLEGNLVIEAAGDPSLNTKVWPKSEDFVAEIVAALKAKGITRIEGNIEIDETYFAGGSIPPTWASGDLPHAYGTGSHSFNYSNNASGKRSVKNPAAQFGADLRTALGASGISIGGNPVSEGVRHTLMKHKSPELKEIMRSCMMRSDNLFAETILRRFGKARGGDGSTQDAAAREMKFWTDMGAEMEGVNIVDGSGLSRSNRVTARFMESVLAKMAGNVEYASFFPLAGQEGTLRKLLAGTELDSYIAMKTGSMSGIQCYAGYKLDDDFAPTHAVVVIVNDFKCDRSYLKTQVERMLLDIFSENY